MQDPARHGEEAADIAPFSSQRVEFFSDGVMAIAMTLLVLGITGQTYSPSQFGHALVTQWPGYVAFLSAFVYIGVMLVNHHRVFARLVAIDLPLMWANMAILLGAVILPFPTNVITQAFEGGTFADQRASVILYALLMTGMGCGWTLFFALLRRRSATWRFPGDRELWNRLLVRSLPGAVGYVVVAGVACFSPWLAVCLLVFFPIFYAVTL